MRKMMTAFGALALLSWTGCAGPTAQATPQAPTPPPAAEASEAEAINPERQDAIERVFQRKVVELQDCWTQEYEKTHDRKLEGNLTLQIMIAASGQPSAVKVLESTLKNANIERCVTQQVLGWNFPEGSTTVPYTRTVHLGAQF